MSLFCLGRQPPRPLSCHSRHRHLSSAQFPVAGSNSHEPPPPRPLSHFHSLSPAQIPTTQQPPLLPFLFATAPILCREPEILRALFTLSVCRHCCLCSLLGSDPQIFVSSLRQLINPANLFLAYTLIDSLTSCCQHNYRLSSNPPGSHART